MSSALRRPQPPAAPGAQGAADRVLNRFLDGLQLAWASRTRQRTFYLSGLVLRCTLCAGVSGRRRGQDDAQPDHFGRPPHRLGPAGHWLRRAVHARLHRRRAAGAKPPSALVVASWLLLRSAHATSVGAVALRATLEDRNRSHQQHQPHFCSLRGGCVLRRVAGAAGSGAEAQRAVADRGGAGLGAQ